MATFNVKTKNGATVEITVTEEQGLLFVNSEIQKLHLKLHEFKSMNEFEAGEAAVISLKAKLNRLEADGKLQDSYTYEELRARTSGASFSGYLAENGIEKSQHGSATRALALGKAALEGLKIAGVTDAATMKAVAQNAIGGKNAEWRDAVLEWLLADAE